MLKSKKNNNRYNPTIKVDSGTIKTPFVRHFTRTGETFSCIYTDKKQIALVVIFSNPELFNSKHTVLVRLHSSCANSDILESSDCDCHSQLQHSIDILRKRNGVLIHLFQEGRGAGIFAKFLGMYTMQNHGLSTYNAYKKLSLSIDVRMYSLAFKILRDLNIKNISLLTNNPRKALAFKKEGFLVNPEPLLGDITPQNFGYLFSKFSEGKHNISTFFPKDTDYYFCKTNLPSGPFNKTWIIDGDDTLWEDNIIYMKIIDDFIKHCLLYVPQVTEKQIRQILNNVEEKTIKKEGFGALGFQKSLEKAYKIIHSKNNSIPKPEKLLNSVVKTITDHPMILVDGVADVLFKLKKRGNGLILYTQGNLNIQFKKIAESNLAEYFHAICVVKFKNDNSLKRLRNDFSFDSGKFIFVGNSLRSDIEPAIQKGFNAVHFNNPNSWPMQNKSRLNKLKYLQIKKLSELLRI